MSDFPEFELKLNAIVIQDRTEWHFCTKCWKDVKKYLNKGRGSIIYSDEFRFF